MFPKSLSIGKILFTTLAFLIAPRLAPAEVFDFVDTSGASNPLLTLRTKVANFSSDYAGTPTEENYIKLIQGIAEADGNGLYPHNVFSVNTVVDGTGGSSAQIVITANHVGMVHLNSGTTFTFTYNETGTSDGGAISLGNNVQAIFTADTYARYIFDRNVAAKPAAFNGHGGAISMNTGLLSLTNTTFSNNQAAVSGGAIYESSGTVLLDDVAFIGNTAGAGGAIFTQRVAHLTNVTFTGNHATGIGGGAIYSDFASGTGILWLANATFTGNIADTGGAIYNENKKMTLANVAFAGNSAFFGGAIYNEGAIATLTDVVFRGNNSGNPAAAPSTRSSNPSRGGAIYNQSGTVTLTNVTFALNFADRGTAIHNRGDGTITGTNLLFAGGVDLYKEPATTVYSGGAIYNDSTSAFFGAALTLTNATFSGNASFESGGALYNNGTGFSASATTATLTNGIFLKNFALASGGAIYNKEGTVTLTDAIFARNHAETGGGAIQADGGVINLVVSSGATSTFSGNSSGPLAGSIRNSLTLSKSGANEASLNVSFPVSGSVLPGILDMRDPIAASGASPMIIQSGNGTWKLGGENVLSVGSAIGAASIHIQGGTLYLYRGDELSDGTDFNGTGAIVNNRGTFALDNGATLAAGGGNEITASSITLASGSKLAFDLAHATTGKPVLTLTRDNNSGTFTVGTSISTDLLSLNAASGNYTLLSATDGDFSGKLTGAVTVRGEAIANTRADALNLNLSGGSGGITLQQNNPLVSVVSTWNGASGDNWNISAAKWTGAAGTQFLHGDVVNFANTDGTDVAIALNPTGNRTVLAAGVHFSGPANYTFSGASLGTDGTAGTSLDGTGALGKLVLGAKAALASGNTTTLDTTATYTGTVDFSGTVANTFSGGIDLYSGTLRIGAAAQIGTRLSNLSFLGVADTPNVPTLRIAQGATVTFFDAGTQNQHLTIAAGKSGALYTESGATLVIEREATGGSGVFSVGAGGKLELGGTGRFIFRGDSDAIHNNGGTGTLKVASGATSLFAGNYSDAVAHSVVLSTGAALNVITDGTDGVLEMHDPISAPQGDWAVTKTGTGAWKLGGNSTLDGTGTFAVKEGTLHLFSANEGIAAVDAGALDLGESGTFELGTSNVTGTGATLVLQTGTSITAAEVTLHSNATTILKIDAAGNTGSIAADTLTIGGDLILDIDVGLIVETWTQFNFFDGAIGQFSSITDSAGKYQWAFDAATGELSFASIPEPSTYALFGAIGAVGLALLRRKKKAAGQPSRTGL